MTKKHFIALADTIQEHNQLECQSILSASGRHKFDSLHIETLASFCQSQNSQFNRERWLGYIAGTCGSNGGTIKPPSKPRYITPERKLARRLEGK